jgi:hypothetical protein
VTDDERLEVARDKVVRAASALVRVPGSPRFMEELTRAVGRLDELRLARKRTKKAQANREDRAEARRERGHVGGH